jgi:DDRGK domain-containing protein 1
VVLEDLAAQFSMKTQDTIDRIKSLESDGLLSGILDDRGKFIYLTEKEISGVVDFINQRGRISIFDLAQESNKLIKLEGEEEEINLDEINFEE